MWVVSVLCCAVLFGHVVASGKKPKRDFQYCLKACTPSTPGDCCVRGVPFRYVELKAQSSIMAGNVVLWRVEQELLQFSKAVAKQQQPSVMPARLSETVYHLAKRALHWLNGVKLTLARFSSHDVVGAAAKRLYNTVRSQVLLLTNLVIWSADEIAGTHSPPPTINGYGPCGGQWPCQQTMTCTWQSCMVGGFAEPIPRSMNPPINAANMNSRSTVLLPPPLSMVIPQYGSNPHDINIMYSPPLPHKPYYINSTLEVPVSILVKKKQEPSNLYGTSPQAGQLEQRRMQFDQDTYAFEQLQQQQQKNRVQLPENDYSFNNRLWDLKASSGNGQSRPISNPTGFEAGNVNFPSTAVPTISDAPPARVQQQSSGQGPFERMYDRVQQNSPLFGIPKSYKIQRTDQQVQS